MEPSPESSGRAATKERGRYDRADREAFALSASTPYTRSLGRLRTLVMLGVLVAPTALAAEATRRVLLLGDDLALPASLQQLEGLRAGCTRTRR